jgi:4-hydroxy-tetrahydrodipicolinate reductase
MIKVAVTGAAGRMGGRIITAIKEAEGLELAGAVERPGHALIGSDAGSVAGCGALDVKIAGTLEEALAGADVLIDFTFPEVTLQNIAVCARLGKSIVIGSTGFTPEQKAEVQKAAAKIPVVSLRT